MTALKTATARGASLNAPAMVQCPAAVEGSALSTAQEKRRQQENLASPAPALSDCKSSNTLKASPIVARLIERIRFDADGCWTWMGTKDQLGYGRIRVGGSHPQAVHRVAYEICVGPIAGGLELDHLCRNRACLNPAHLEAVTRRENIMRSSNFAAVNARKTHCPQGHEYNEENTCIGKPSAPLNRICRVCSRERMARKRAAAKNAGKQRKSTDIS